MKNIEELKSWFEDDKLYVGKYVKHKINQLDEPEVLSQELPVIPNYVAKWISVHHEQFDLYPALKRLESNALSWEDVYEWYRRNTHTFVNAYLTGKYEVEEEPKYVIDTDDVGISDGNHYLTHLSLSKDDTELPIVGYKDDAIRFDNKEQAQAIADYVGGRVEELEE